MDTVLTMGTASYAHTYGNIVEAVKMDILSKFPPDYFRYKHVSSQLAFREMKRYKDNSLVEFRKQEKPKIYIRPTFEVADDSTPLFGTLLTSHTTCGTGAISRLSLMPIFKDDNRHLEMDFRMNRDRVSFDVNIQVETLIRQLDLYKNMQNMISWDAPHMKIFSLESMIPRQMIQYLAKNAGMQIDNTPGSIGAIISYLINHSRYPITYKIRNSSSLDEFFMYYEVPVYLTYSDFQIDEGTKKGMIDDYYGISFRVLCEFNHPGAYVIRSINGYPDTMPTVMRIEEDLQTELIPLYTLDRLYEANDKTLEGYRMYFTTAIHTEKELSHKDDIVDLNDIIENEYIRVIKKYIFSYIPTDILMRAKMFKDKEELISDIDFEIDWNTMLLTIHNSDPTVTYRLLLYANQTKFQEEFQTMMELAKRDKTYQNLENPVEINDTWREREGNMFIESGGEYFMPKSSEKMNHSMYTNERLDDSQKGS